MNQNYDQVLDLVLADKLSWERDPINALLFAGETFDPSNTNASDFSSGAKAVQRINGRLFLQQMALGLPVAFPKVQSGPDYQVVLTQDTGNNDPTLLAWIDVNADGLPITVQNTGTLIIRPVLPAEPVPGLPSNGGVWMRFPA